MAANGRGIDVMDGIAIIDADTHLTEPHDLWTSRAPREWADRVPQVRAVKGRSMWTIDGEVFGNAVGASVILPDGSWTWASTASTPVRRRSSPGSR